MGKNKKIDPSSRPTRKVKIKFSQDMYYNDLNKPLYRAGETVEMETTEDMIQRWVKRGGEVVSGETCPAPAKVEPKVEAPAPAKEEAVAADKKSDEAIEQEVDKVDEVVVQPAPTGKNKYSKNK